MLPGPKFFGVCVGRCSGPRWWCHFFTESGTKGWLRPAVTRFGCPQAQPDTSDSRLAPMNGWVVSIRHPPRTPIRNCIPQAGSRGCQDTLTVSVVFHRAVPRPQAPQPRLRGVSGGGGGGRGDVCGPGVGGGGRCDDPGWPRAIKHVHCFPLLAWFLSTFLTVIHAFNLVKYH